MAPNFASFTTFTPWSEFAAAAPPPGVEVAAVLVLTLHEAARMPNASTLASAPSGTTLLRVWPGICMSRLP
jgi:hypothetical protein